MTRNPPENRIPHTQHMTSQMASTLLRMGMSGPRRPVDDLIDRLRQPDGAAWLVKALETGPLNGLGTAAELFGQGRITIEQCVTIKEASKSMVGGASGPGGRRDVEAGGRLAGIAGYFLSLAAGLHFHDVLLTTRERAKLAETWLDLAEAAPEPFSKLLSEAALEHEGN